MTDKPPRAPPREYKGEWSLYRRALEGEVPAESLPTFLRWRLVATLHRAGLSDVEIAEVSRMSTYTTARIRAGMGLKPNTCEQERNLE